MDYEYNEYENSPEVLKHDLDLLNKVKIIRNSLRELLELRLEEINNAITRITPYDKEEMEVQYIKILNNRKQELEIYKRALVNLEILLDSAIREGTKWVIQELCNIFKNRISIKEQQLFNR